MIWQRRKLDSFKKKESFHSTTTKKGEKKWTKKRQRRRMEEEIGDHLLDIRKDLLFEVSWFFLLDFFWIFPVDLEFFLVGKANLWSTNLLKVRSGSFLYFKSDLWLFFFGWIRSKKDIRQIKENIIESNSKLERQMTFQSKWSTLDFFSLFDLFILFSFFCYFKAQIDVDYLLKYFKIVNVKKIDYARFVANRFRDQFENFNALDRRKSLMRVGKFDHLSACALIANYLEPDLGELGYKLVDKAREFRLPTPKKTFTGQFDAYICPRASLCELQMRAAFKFTGKCNEIDENRALVQLVAANYTSWHPVMLVLTNMVDYFKLYSLSLNENNEKVVSVIQVKDKREMFIAIRFWLKALCSTQDYGPNNLVNEKFVAFEPFSTATKMIHDQVQSYLKKI